MLIISHCPIKINNEEKLNCLAEVWDYLWISVIYIVPITICKRHVKVHSSLEYHIISCSFHTDLLLLLKDGCEPCKLLSFHFRSHRLNLFLLIFFLRTFLFNLGQTYQENLNKLWYVVQPLQYSNNKMFAAIAALMPKSTYNTCDKVCLFPWFLSPW